MSNGQNAFNEYPFEHELDDADWAFEERFNRGSGRDHRGKGPKNYERPDRSIYEEACEELWKSALVDAEDIEVKVEHGYVSLFGSVADRQQKKFAEAIVERLSGVKDIMNYITVRRSTGLLSDMNLRANII